MKKFCAILMVSLLCCGLLCSCGEEAAAPQDNTKLYSNLTEPAVDVKITDCVTEQQLTAILGHTMLAPVVGEQDTQATYYSDEGTCVVDISLKNQTLELFNTAIAALGDTVTLYEGVGEAAYWCESEIDQLLVYQNGYFLGVAVSIQGAESVETQTRQIAELVVAALQPAA